MNIGSVEASFKIAGLEKSLKDLNTLYTKLTSVGEGLGYTFDESLKLIEGFKGLSKASASVLKNQTELAGANDAVVASGKRLVAQIEQEKIKLGGLIAKEQTLLAIKEKIKASIATMQSGVPNKEISGVKQLSTTWQQFMKERMSGYMQLTGSHSAAMKQLGADWRKYKTEVLAGTAAENTAVNKPFSRYKQFSQRSTPLVGQSTSLSAPINPANQIREQIGNFANFQKQSSSASLIPNLASMTSGFNNFSTAVAKNEGILTSWYQHFGRIAAGYAVAYAAIRAVQSAFMGVFNVFKDGVKTLDDIRSSGATVAGMLAFLDKSAGGFAKNFEKHFAGSQQVLQRAMVLLPKYSLTLEQFNAGQRELAQFGVKVTGNNIEKTIITLKTLQEIAANTPGDVRQIRQELQALFTGAKPRPSDQFLKFIQTSAPDLFATFAKMRKEGKTTQEMWEVLTDRMKMLGPAMQQGAKTIETQFMIMKKSISVISAKAQDTSGIYDTWLNKLMKFNQSLFTTEGGLTTFGTKIYDAFYRAWQVVDLIISGISIVVKVTKAFVETIWKVFTSNFGQAFLKTLGAIYATFAGILIIVGEVVASIIGLGNISGLGKLTGALVGMYTVVTLTAFAWGLLITQLTRLAGTSLVLSVSKALTGLFLIFQTGGVTAVIATIGSLAASFGLLMIQIVAVASAGLALGGVFVGLGVMMKNVLDGDMGIGAGTKAMKEYYQTIKDMATEGTGFLKDVVGGTGLGEVLMPDAKDIITKFRALTEEIQHEILKAAKAGDDDLVNQLLGLGGKGPEENLNAWSDALRHVKFEKLDKIDYKIEADVQTPYYDAIKTYNEKMAEDFKLTFLKIRLEADSFGNYLGNSFKGLFTSVFAHEVTTFAQFFQGALKSIQESFASMLSDMVSEYFTAMMRMQFQKGAADTIFSMFGGGSIPSPAGGIDPTKFSLASLTSLPTSRDTIGNYSLLDNNLYTGGMINEPVWGVGKSGATYSFAERGPERVLSNSETKGYASKSSSAPNVINFINESGVPMTATQSAPQFDGEKYVTSIIVKQMATNPSFRSSMRG